MDSLTDKVKRLGADWEGRREDVCDLLGFSLPTLNRYLNKKLIRYDRARGRRKLFSRAEVLRFLRDWYCNPKRGVNA